MFNQGTNKINKLKSFGIGKHDFQVGQVQQYERERERERLKHHSDKCITSILKHGHKPEGDLVDWIAVFDLNKPVADQR